MRALRVVDDQGEVHDDCPGCSARNDIIAGLEHTIRSLSAKNTALKRDKDAAARANEAWPRAQRLWRYFLQSTGREREKNEMAWTAERFWQVNPFLSDFSDAYIEQAIRGLAYQPYTQRLRSGRIEVYNEWSHLFKNEDALRRYHGRAPVSDPVAFLDTRLPPDESPPAPFLLAQVFDER